MFTGIIDNLGKVEKIIKKGKNLEVIIKPETKDYLNDVEIGDSISVNGVCLTVTEKNSNSFKLFVSSETVNITNLKLLNTGEYVNLEKSLRLSDRLDGHIVLGHIDGTGICTGLNKIGNDYELKIRVPAEMLKFIVPKGSIAINGVSLTIARIRSDIITMIIIPATYNRTNIKYLKIGSKVNIETDILGKYVMNVLRHKVQGAVYKV